MQSDRKKIPYFEIYRQALSLAWKNRFLWWFGLFITFSSAFASFDMDGRKSASTGRNISDLVMAHQNFAIAAGLAILAIIIILASIGILGRGALIRSINEIIENREADFKSGIRAGKKNFWRIFFIGLGINLFDIAILIILATPVMFLFFTKAYAIGILLAVLAVLILIPLFFLASYLKIFGYIYSVLGDLPALSSLENAYELLAKNLVPSIIILLLFIPIYILLGIAILAVLVPATLFFIMIGFFLTMLFKEIGTEIALILGSITIAICLLSAKSIYEVFAETVWVLFFREIARRDEQEKADEKKEKIETIPTPTPMENI